MARVTVEDCILKIPNRFQLVMVAAQRSRELSIGAELTVDRDNDKNPVVALREIADETVDTEEIESALVRSLQKYVDIEEQVDESDAFLAAEEAFGDFVRMGFHRADAAAPAHRPTRAMPGPRWSPSRTSRRPRPWTRRTARRPTTSDLRRAQASAAWRGGRDGAGGGGRRWIGPMIRQYELVERVKAYDPSADEDALNRAYVFSMKAHGSQTRAVGRSLFLASRSRSPASCRSSSSTAPRSSPACCTTPSRTPSPRWTRSSPISAARSPGWSTG